MDGKVHSSQWVYLGIVIRYVDHQDNMSMLLMPHCTSILYSNTGVYRGIHFFLIFASKHRLWVLVRTATEAVLTCNHNLSFEQK